MIIDMEGAPVQMHTQKFKETVECVCLQALVH